LVREYEVTPKQREFLENRARFRAFIGGWGCGKTTAGCLEAIRVSLMYEGASGLVVRKTFRELVQTTLGVLFDLMPWELVWSHNKREGKIEIGLPQWKKPSVIYYMSLDDKKKLEGLNLGWFYIDEAVEVEEEFWVTLLGRLRHPVGPRRAWITTTPPSYGHWIYKWFNRGGDFAIVQAKTYDNPYLSSDYIRMLEDLFQGDDYRKYVMGEMGADRSGSVVFANFNPSLHVLDESEVEEILKSVPSMYRGIDFGFYKPAAVWAILDEWSRLIVVGEYLGQSEPLDAFVQRLKRIDVERFGGKRVLADYHDPHSTYTTDIVRVDRAEILREHGLNPVPALGGSIESGILLMQTLMDRLVMGKPLLMVSSACRLLIEGFRGGYVWDENGKKPKKTGIYEHLFDALRYLVVGLNKKIGVGTWQKEEIGSSEYRMPRGLTYTETFKVR
jgi:PBSX family phage terminase large subunit